MMIIAIFTMMCLYGTIYAVGDFSDVLINDLNERSQLASSRESDFQSLLLRDRQKCLLKIICRVGANASQYGNIQYALQIASSLGYYYKPFDFTVVDDTVVFEKLHLETQTTLVDEPIEVEATHLGNSMFSIKSHLSHSKRLPTWIKVKPSPISKAPIMTKLNKPGPITNQKSEPIAKEVVLPAKEITKYVKSEPIVKEVVLPAKEITKYVKSEPIVKEVVIHAKEITKYLKSKPIVKEVDLPAKEITKNIEHKRIIKEVILPAAEIKKYIKPEAIVKEIVLPAKEVTKFVNSTEINKGINDKPVSIQEEFLEVGQGFYFPAACHLFRAFIFGLKTGIETCNTFFDQCSMKNEDIVRFTSSLFRSP